MSAAAKRIAVVDDDDSVRRALDRLLRASGFATSCYSSAEAFLDGGAAGCCDCLVLDVHLGGMSGFDLRCVLRERQSQLPVIFISAHENAETVERANTAGCFAFFNKPVPGATLLDAIRVATGDSAAAHAGP